VDSPTAVYGVRRACDERRVGAAEGLGTLVHPFRPRDIIRVYRLQRAGVCLDLERQVLYGYRPWYVALQAWVQHGAVTYLSRSSQHRDTRWGMVQAMRRGDRPEWDVTFLAPRPDDVPVVTRHWRLLLTQVIQDMVGGHAHRVYAAVPHEPPLAGVFQEVGFSLYSKETIYRLQMPVSVAAQVPTGVLRPPRRQDEWELKRLWHRVTPRLVLAAQRGGLNNGPRLPHAWTFYPDLQVRVWEVAGELWGAVGVRSGRKGCWMRLLVEWDATDGVAGLVAAGLNLAQPNSRRPVYCALPEYMGGVEGALLAHGFVPWDERVLLVRHVALPVLAKDLAQQKLTAFLEMGREPALSRPLQGEDVAACFESAPPH